MAERLDLTGQDRTYIAREIRRMRARDEVIRYAELAAKFNVTKSQLQYCLQREDEMDARKFVEKIQRNLKAGKPAGSAE